MSSSRRILRRVGTLLVSPCSGPTHTSTSAPSYAFPGGERLSTPSPRSRSFLSNPFVPLNPFSRPDPNQIERPRESRRQDQQHLENDRLAPSSTSTSSTSTTSSSTSTSTGPAIRYAECRVVPFAPEAVLRVVTQVEHYHEFVPWCLASPVLTRIGQSYLEADLEVGFQFLRERYKSCVMIRRSSDHPDDHDHGHGHESASASASDHRGGDDPSVTTPLRSADGRRRSHPGTPITTTPSSSSSVPSHTSVRSTRSSEVRSVVRDSRLFRKLETNWKIEPGSHPQETKLSFAVEFAFRSTVYDQISQLFLNEVVKQMIVAFMNRVRRLEQGGRKSRYTQY